MKAAVVVIWICLIVSLQRTSYGNHVEPKNGRYSVVVVGAGLSGYSAAAKLMENKVVDILVLEAEDRIGGRVHSIPTNAGTIDMGAQWLHGQQGNVIYEMIGENFTFGDSTFENATNYFWQSNGVPENQTQIGILANLSEAIMEVVYDPTYFGTFGSFFVTNYWREVRSIFTDIPWSLAMKVQEFFHTYVNNYFGTTSWFDISIEVYSTHGYTLGSQWVTWRDEGFATVFEFLSKRRPDPSQYLDVESRILINKEVVDVSWSGDVINLLCSDDTEYSADYVIFTPSLGVLKDRHATLFNPQLPDRKVSAIEHSEYGSLEKILLEFAAPFWDTSDNFAQYSILWTQQDIDALRGTPREWLIDIAYFRRVDAFPNFLGTFFIGSRIPDFEAFNETKIIEDCHWLLTSITRQNVPFAVNVYRSDWITKKHFMGSYSLFTMNSAHHGADPAALAEPVKNTANRSRIFFAGEHTSDQFSGYANGAVESGFRAAAEVIEQIDRSSGSRTTSKYSVFVIFALALLNFFFAELTAKI